MIKENADTSVGSEKCLKEIKRYIADCDKKADQ